MLRAPLRDQKATVGGANCVRGPVDRAESSGAATEIMAVGIGGLHGCYTLSCSHG